MKFDVQMVGASLASEPAFDRAACPPVLLANPDFYGTLAAARSLGARGVPVYIAADRILAAARWSRHVTRALASPPLEEPRRFIDWLLRVGARERGIVLYPTSDEAAFLYALHVRELSESFRMYQPDVEALLRVLDKRKLYGIAQGVGLEVPDTWFPESESDVARIAREVPMPVLIKPRTQVLSWTHSKGIIVERREDLLPRYREFTDASRFGPALLNRFPDAAKAMIQQYLPEGADRIYVLAAFVNESGSLYAVRSGMKIFQRPRRLGIGLCFQGAPVDRQVSEGARRMAVAAGYFGLFQLEFIQSGDRRLLIDFNPRFYNQLAFDVARGLPLPAIVHAAARGAMGEVQRLIEGAGSQPEDQELVFCNRFGLKMMLSLQRAVGRMSREEVSHWRAWSQKHRVQIIDPAIQTDDRLPGLVDVASQVYGFARHPRAFLRKVVFDLTPA